MKIEILKVGTFGEGYEPLCGTPDGIYGGDCDPSGNPGGPDPCIGDSGGGGGGICNCRLAAISGL